jgi:fibronectin type 3 domain-containing protein
VPFYPPSGLTATPAPEGGVALQWNAVAGAKSYKVKRASTPKGPFGWVAPAVATTRYVDRTAEAGSQYYYVVATNPV